MHIGTLMAKGGDAEARKVLLADLKHDPKDLFALHMLATVEKRLGRFDDARQHAERALAMQSHAGLMNEMAWMSLFTAKGVTDDDIAMAIRATKLEDSVSYLHTLASLYADAGQLYNARTTLHEILSRRVGGLPDHIDYFIIGRMAEHFGLDEVARAAFGKVEAPPTTASDATYVLAQRRMKKLPGSR